MCVPLRWFIYNDDDDDDDCVFGDTDYMRTIAKHMPTLNIVYNIINVGKLNFNIKLLDDVIKLCK